MDIIFLKQYESIQILGHDNVDFDSIASCYTMQQLLAENGISSVIVVPDDKIPETFN